MIIIISAHSARFRNQRPFAGRYQKNADNKKYEHSTLVLKISKSLDAKASARYEPKNTAT